MKKNLFEMGAKFEDDWSSDNKVKPKSTTQNEIKEPSKHLLHFAKEKRRGKVITLIKPFYLSKQDMQKLLKTLKNKLATGGTINEQTIELQGELSQRAKEELLKLGYRFKS